MPPLTTPLSTTSHALLGLLSVREWTTYELAKQVQRSLHWFWPRAERKLYDEPKRLVAAGLATSAGELTGKRARTVYRITRAGRAELRSWLAATPAPPTLEFEGMVKVFFATGGSKADLQRTLTTVRHEAAERRRALAAMATEALDGSSPFPERLHVGALTMRFQADFERLVEEWAAWAGDEVATWKSTRDPRPWSPDTVLADIAGRG